jgi:hypothetical protein
MNIQIIHKNGISILFPFISKNITNIFYVLCFMILLVCFKYKLTKMEFLFCFPLFPIIIYNYKYLYIYIYKQYKYNII